MKMFYFACVMFFVFIVISAIFLIFLNLWERLDKKFTKAAYSGANYRNTKSKRSKQAGSRGPNIIKQGEEPKFPECLSILGFTKEPENKDDIKMRYKKLSKIYHPDMGGTQEEFQRINKAWAEARKLYGLK